ncbi:MAG: outer membrane lipoprotein carrier protein LolA [Deltaproteobacteria bacterium]|nr:MAG: outer membrane lipoprotein carrier protein LolA [Deltaproteobacteria bacterium]
MPALIVALLAAAQSQAPAARDPATAIAQRVQRHYERIQDFSARFAQTSTYPTFGNVKNATGKVFLKKPVLLRWQYDDGRLIVIDGKELWNWNPEDKEAQVKRGFGADQVPSEFAFLFGKGKLLDRFTVRSVARPGDLPPGEAIELVPRKPSADVQRLLFVVDKRGQVLASVLTNGQGDVNQLVFSEAKVSSGLPDSLFRFVPPKDAHVQVMQ